MQNLFIFYFLKNAIILCGNNNLQQDSHNLHQEDKVDGITKIGFCFKERQHHIDVFICRLLPRDEYASVYTPMLVKQILLIKINIGLN